MATPRSNVESSALKIEYILNGDEMEWYLKFYYSQLKSEEGRTMIYIGLSCIGCCVLCWLISVGVCLRHCCFRYCCDCCAYKEDKEEAENKLFEDAVYEFQNNPHFNMEVYDQIDNQSMSAVGSQKYGHGNLNIENFKYGNKENF